MNYITMSTASIGDHQGAVRACPFEVMYLSQVRVNISLREVGLPSCRFLSCPNADVDRITGNDHAKSVTSSTLG
jgi:hypothetical protein